MRTGTKASAMARVMAVSCACVCAPGALAQIQYTARAGVFRVQAGATVRSFSYSLGTGDVAQSDSLLAPGAPCQPVAAGSAAVTTTLAPGGFAFYGQGSSYAAAALCGNALQGDSQTAEDIRFTLGAPTRITLTGVIEGCVSPADAHDPTLSVSLTGPGGEVFALSYQGSFDHDFASCRDLDAGEYHLVCSARSTASSPAQAEWSGAFQLGVYLDVLGAGPVYATPASSSVCPGGQAVLSVPKAGGGEFSYQWRKNGVNLADGPRVSGSDTRSLAISGAVATDAGAYECVITSACGPVTTTPATLTLCAADYNCSGAVTVQDIFDYLASWFAHDARADLNGVSGVTVQDIFDFLGAWFAGC